MTKIAECGRCGRRLVIHAKGMCEHCYKHRKRNPNAKVRPAQWKIKSIEPVEIPVERIVEQPKEPKPEPPSRVDSPSEAFSRRDMVILRARAALAVA